MIFGGVASKTFAAPGVPSGPTESKNPDPVCALYQLEGWSPSPMEAILSIETFNVPLPADHGLALAESKTIFWESLRTRSD